MTSRRVDRHFFAQHTVTELDTWTDFELENQGRLTEPMAYDAASNRYVPISWDDAFAMIGDELRALDSLHQASFYTSGRLGNEATFLYQLMAREYGTNNLPDCSNMCHEASGRALQASLGTGKGTADLKDWETAEALFILGVNAASNAPRMLTALTEAFHRGAQIVHVNPLIQAASRRAIIPHEAVDMALFKATRTGTLQVRPGGDMAPARHGEGAARGAPHPTPRPSTRSSSSATPTASRSAPPWSRPRPGRRSCASPGSASPRSARPPRSTRSPTAR
jgi:anaerobic selenocysteine-containing dehydrogenase